MNGHPLVYGGDHEKQVKVSNLFITCSGVSNHNSSKYSTYRGTEVQAATYFLQLKKGAKVFCEGMNQGHEIISETGTVTKASRNQFLLKFNRAVRTSLGRLDTDRDDKYDYRMSIFNVYLHEYIQDVGSLVDGAAHKPGFQVVFLIGYGKDDDSAHSMVQNGLVEKAYVYLDDLVNKDMEQGHTC